jgi:hypothetical protein
MSYEDLSNKELVMLCLVDDRAAWEEFFRRFIPTIKFSIRSTLITSGNLKLINDEDVLWDIHADVVNKLVKDGILEQCRDMDKLESWLRRVARNESVNYLRSRSLHRNLPQVTEEGFMTSLDKPLGEDGELPFVENVMDEYSGRDSLEERHDLNILLTDTFSKMQGMENRKGFWVLRLSIIAYEPLSDEEIEELSEFNEMPPEEIRSRLIAIMDELEEKMIVKIKAQARAVVISYRINRAEAFLLKAFEEEAQEKLREQIEELRQQWENNVKDGRMYCQPARKDIALLVGMPEEKVGQVSKVLERARSFLASGAREERYTDDVNPG